MRAAVVGTNWGRVHVAALRDAGVEVVALAAADPHEVRGAADELGVPLAVADLAALGGLGLDLACVATPAATHADVIDALPDVPVLCEKPAVGLAPVRALAPRRAPVWVNLAFAFLDVAVRAAGSLHRIGRVRAASVTSGHDLPELRLGPEAMLFELVPHPWSWLVTLLGPPAPPSAAGSGDTLVPTTSTVVRVRCGDVPVTVACRRERGLAGLRHAVVLDGECGRLTLSGRYRRGHAWWFDPPELALVGHVPEPLGDPEGGPGDPWYRANARSIGAVVATLGGAPPTPQLFDWDRAVAMDVALQAELVGAAEARHGPGLTRRRRGRGPGAG
ncbi:MAG: Gfo/Idh/MocA family oxidoreductase [Candidatus Nanopelagicales bacterium]|nr:Gfo/Idh/MocA family oxidoreductase [Candidatus Nanopelagicales bacterium]